MTFIVDGTNGLTFNNSTTQASAGVVLQVVNATTSVAASNSTSTYADTGLTATITPKFTTSKILILIDQAGMLKDAGNSQSGVNAQILRGATVLYKFANNYGYTNSSLTNIVGVGTASYLDSPATISATTYKTQFANATNAASVSVQDGNAVSSITLLEIAG
jgi:hypothetical protein